MKSIEVVISFFVLICAVSSVHAQDTRERISFRGSVIDGPFATSTIDGYCNRRLRDSSYQQTTRCVVTIGNGYKIVDSKASVKVIGSNRALQIIFGPTMNDDSEKGNFKLSSFQATTYFDREISLFDIPDYFLAVEVSIGGVSIAGGTTSTNPDCLIWDIVGDGVFK